MLFNAKPNKTKNIAFDPDIQQILRAVFKTPLNIYFGDFLKNN